MKILVWVQGGGTERLTVRFRAGETPSHRNQEEGPFTMKAEQTIDKSVQAGRATQIAATVTTSIVAFM
jgi:hypothetical protein